MRHSAIPALTLLLAGCATAPEEIAPRDTDHTLFMAYDCQQLSERELATQAELDRYVASQNRARVGDAFTWPVSTARMFGKNRRNVEAISRLRGDLLAIDRARAQKKCTYAD